MIFANFALIREIQSSWKFWKLLISETWNENVEKYFCSVDSFDPTEFSRAHDFMRVRNFQ